MKRPRQLVLDVATAAMAAGISLQKKAEAMRIPATTLCRWRQLAALEKAAAPPPGQAGLLSHGLSLAHRIPRRFAG